MSLPWIYSSSSCPRCSCLEPPASQEARSELSIPQEQEQGRASGREPGPALGRAAGAGTGHTVPVPTPALDAVVAAAAAAVAAVPGVEVGRRRQAWAVAPAAGAKEERTWNSDSGNLGGWLDEAT